MRNNHPLSGLCARCGKFIGLTRAYCNDCFWPKMHQIAEDIKAKRPNEFAYLTEEAERIVNAKTS